MQRYLKLCIMINIRLESKIVLFKILTLSKINFHFQTRKVPLEVVRDLQNIVITAIYRCYGITSKNKTRRNM